MRDDLADFFLGYAIIEGAIQVADQLALAPERDQRCDDDQAAMKKTILATWREAWQEAHPGKHGAIHLKLIDFIGRTIWTGTIKA